MKLHCNLLAAAAAVLAFFIAVPNSVTAEAKAREHQAMARTYPSAGGPESNGNSMVRHCERLVTEYTNVAADYRALATNHHQMAWDAAK